MADDIKLRSPEEVKAQVLRIAAVLETYEEELQKDAQLYNLLGQTLEEASRELSHHQQRLHITLEQLKKVPEKSDAALRTQSYVETQLSASYDRSRQIDQCYTEYEAICQDVSSALRESAQFTENGRALSTKIGKLLTEIIDSM